jgi:hypothetical protein
MFEDRYERAERCDHVIGIHGGISGQNLIEGVLTIVFNQLSDAASNIASNVSKKRRCCFLSIACALFDLQDIVSAPFQDELRQRLRSSKVHGNGGENLDAFDWGWLAAEGM